MASDLLKAAGFSGETLAIALGVSYVEADGPQATARFGKQCAYGDAVGDLSLVNEKWGPSLSLFQVRVLRHPEQFSYPDTLRVAEDVRHPKENAVAAFAISKKGTYWKPWSTFVSGSYLPHKGKDFEVVSGHPRANLWNVGEPAEFTTSEKLGQFSVDGYLVNNNVHNAAEAGTQTLYAYGPDSWYVLADHSRTDVRPGSVKSYPDTQRNFTNRSIDSFSKITAAYDMSNPAVGEWNAAFDIWIGGIGSRSTAEVMVWTDHRYPASIPPGNALETKTVTIDGQPYKAWRRKNGNGGDYIALVMDPKRPAGTVDLLKVFKWLVSVGWLKSTDLVAAIEYGVEISNTPAGSPQTFRLNNYQLTAE